MNLHRLCGGEKFGEWSHNDKWILKILGRKLWQLASQHVINVLFYKYFPVYYYVSKIFYSKYHEQKA